MGVSPLDVSQTTNTTTTSASAASAAGSPSLDKNAFLKLLVAQLQNQDPTQPSDPTAFITQLSQFSLVEQALNQSQQLQTLGTQLTGISNEEVTTLVGKTVTVKGSGVAFDGVTGVSSGATLDGPAADVTVAVHDPTGKTVRTIDMGPRGAGPFTMQWDGRDDAGNLCPAGTYTFTPTAKAQDGTAVSIEQQVTGVVSNVSYDKGYPLITLDSGVSAPISDLISVAGAAATTTP